MRTIALLGGLLLAWPLRASIGDGDAMTFLTEGSRITLRFEEGVNIRPDQENLVFRDGGIVTADPDKRPCPGSCCYLHFDPSDKERLLRGTATFTLSQRPLPPSDRQLYWWGVSVPLNGAFARSLSCWRWQVPGERGTLPTIGDLRRHFGSHLTLELPPPEVVGPEE